MRHGLRVSSGGAANPYENPFRGSGKILSGKTAGRGAPLFLSEPVLPQSCGFGFAAGLLKQNRKRQEGDEKERRCPRGIRIFRLYRFGMRRRVRAAGIVGFLQREVPFEGWGERQSAAEDKACAHSHAHSFCLSDPFPKKARGRPGCPADKLFIINYKKFYRQF